LSVAALTSAFVQIAAATSGGTAPGGVTAPTGCTLTTPTDLSPFVISIEDGMDVDTKDVTAFGSGGYAAMVASLKHGVVNLSILQDYAAGGPNALLGLNGSVIPVGGTGFIEVRPANAARGSGNPGFIAKVINNGWRPINASVGEVPTVAWNVAITGGFAELIA
jgi:hypothetical protein